MPFGNEGLQDLTGLALSGGISRASLLGLGWLSRINRFRGAGPPEHRPAHRAAGVSPPRSNMARRILLFAAMVLLGTAVSPSPASPAEFASCADVRDYLKNPLPEGLYAQVQDLEKAVEVVRRESSSPAGSCDELLAERAFFEYANALDRYSRTFPNDPQATQRWAHGAADAYGEYLDWFLSLSDAQQNRLIRILTQTQRAPEDEFRPVRGRWLRTRVGNVLNSLGVSFVRAQAHEELLGAYDRFFRMTIEIFPNEVAKKWYKWLRAKPDFQVAKLDAEIKALVLRDADYLSQWEAFKEFLETFIPANPSVRTEWEAVVRRIRQWLS